MGKDFKLKIFQNTLSGEKHYALVKNLSNDQNPKYVRMHKLDITKDKLPRSDLMICRDLLFHLSYNDIFLFFENFLSSDINYILINSHSNNNNIFENKDIITGDFRLLDIFSVVTKSDIISLFDIMFLSIFKFLITIS